MVDISAYLLCVLETRICDKAGDVGTEVKQHGRALFSQVAVAGSALNLPAGPRFSLPDLDVEAITGEPLRNRQSGYAATDYQCLGIVHTPGLRGALLPKRRAVSTSR